MHEDLHDVQVDLQHPWVLGLVGQQHELDAQQGDEDERGPDGPHVQAGLGLVRHPQLGDQDPHDVEQEEQVHLEVKSHSVRNGRASAPPMCRPAAVSSYHQRGADGRVDDVEQRGIRTDPAPAKAPTSWSNGADGGT